MPASLTQILYLHSFFHNIAILVDRENWSTIVLCLTEHSQTVVCVNWLATHRFKWYEIEKYYHLNDFSRNIQYLRLYILIIKIDQKTKANYSFNMYEKIQKTPNMSNVLLNHCVYHYKWITCPLILSIKWKCHPLFKTDL